MKITKSRINTMRFIVKEPIRINNEISISIKNKSLKEFYEKEYGEGTAGLEMFFGSPNKNSKKYKKDPTI